MRGKLIVLEGIDGAGTETQSKALIARLQAAGFGTMRIQYPDYGPDKENPTKPIGKLLHEYLHEKYDFDEKLQFLLYSADMIKDIAKIKAALDAGKIVVADRYFTSTIAYQGLRGFPIENALQYAKIFGLIQPGITIYLDISPETSIKRKRGEKPTTMDRNERDKQLFTKLTKFYKEKLAARNIFGKWVVIDGEASIRDVTNKIVATLRSELGLKI